ncbi:hypothetical protein Vretimale_9449 [Volvox reticuliferus]|nr:hypothetical protein Vretifemale_9863 [Volvox reticuliferus]GIM04979.1 hypothetical protein Vretimale_9449 [Volvox reticuliferus]
MLLEEMKSSMQPPSLRGVDVFSTRAHPTVGMPTTHVSHDSVHGGRYGPDGNEAADGAEVLKRLEPLALLQALGLAEITWRHPVTTAGLAEEEAAARAAGLPALVAATAAGCAAPDLRYDRHCPNLLMQHNTSLDQLMHMERYDLRTGFTISTANCTSRGSSNCDGGGVAASRCVERRLQVIDLQPRVLVLPPQTHECKEEAAASQPRHRGSWPIRARLSWMWGGPPQIGREKQHPAPLAPCQQQQKPQQHPYQAADKQGTQPTAQGKQQQQQRDVGASQGWGLEVVMRTSRGEGLPVRVSLCPSHTFEEVCDTGSLHDLDVESEKNYDFDFDVELLCLPASPGVVLVEFNCTTQARDQEPNNDPPGGFAPNRHGNVATVPLLVIADPGVAVEVSTAAAAWPATLQSDLDELLYDMGAWAAAVRPAAAGADTTVRKASSQVAAFVGDRSGGGGGANRVGSDSGPDRTVSGFGAHLLSYAEAAGWEATASWIRTSLSVAASGPQVQCGTGVFSGLWETAGDETATEG